MKISIPEPCHEDWTAMTPRERGRHCASCAKTVVDFTAMTDAEVVGYLRGASGETCGRVRPTQLDRRLAGPPVLPVGLTQPLRHGMAAATLAVGVAAGTSATAQTAPKPTVTKEVPRAQVMGLVEMPFPHRMPVDTVGPDTVADQALEDYVDDFLTGEIAPIDFDELPDTDTVPEPKACAPVPPPMDASAIAGRMRVHRTPVEQVVDTVRRAFARPSLEPAVLLYPNPSRRTATVELKHVGAAILVNVYAADGRLVLSRPVVPGAASVELQLGPDAADGRYNVEVTDARGERLTTAAWIVE